MWSSRYRGHMDVGYYRVRLSGKEPANVVYTGGIQQVLIRPGKYLSRKDAINFFDRGACHCVTRAQPRILHVSPIGIRSFEDRKFTIHHIAPLFMLYESTFGTLKFDWVEAHARSAKIMEITTDSGIVLVGLKGIRIGDDREIWQMEVSGSPSTPTFGGTKKSINTDILNLVKVYGSLAVDEPPTESMIEAAKIDYATRLFLHTQQQLQQVYSSPSEDKERKNNKGFAIFHDELVQQEAIMNKIDRILIPCEGKCVRDVLNLRDI
ncbi:hypothetical protein RhiirA4_525237 [Rhizophagus irregularis]|uniref:Uncharacterized protein n=1 Tax=Rhizophagus irregularis TaxID=588596 RepID=A0A2I1GP95_9GLOM|nr:hypothetical protein RhiirA4_525237 [Rhizophagus irregularis]